MGRCLRQVRRIVSDSYYLNTDRVMAAYKINDRIAPSASYPYPPDRAKARPRHHGTVVRTRKGQVRVLWDGLRTPEWLAIAFVQRIPDYVEELAADFYERMNPPGLVLLSLAECRDIARRHFESQKTPRE